MEAHGVEDGGGRRGGVQAESQAQFEPALRRCSTLPRLT